MAQNFAAKVDAWVLERQQDLVWIFREAAQRVIADMQKPVGAGGNMPVDTGFLRSSLIATLNSPSSTVRFNSESTFAREYSDSQVSLVILGAKIGDVIYAVYSANYAGYVEYGTHGRPGRGFVRLATQNWQQVVDRVVSEAKSRG